LPGQHHRIFQIKLPGWFLITIVNLSVGHTRALLSVHTAGTRFADKILPIANANEMALAFFGKDAMNVI